MMRRGLLSVASVVAVAAALIVVAFSGRSESFRRRDVFLGGIYGWEALADPRSTAALRATRRAGLYLHFNATDAKLEPYNDRIANVFSGESTVIETGLGGGFNRLFFSGDIYRTKVLAFGFKPQIAVVNTADTYAVPWAATHVESGQDLADFKDFVVAGRANGGPRIYAPNVSPNQSGGVGGVCPHGGAGASCDAATPFIAHPWSDDGWWGNLKQAALYGGGISLDVPPVEYLDAFPDGVQQTAYKAFVTDVIRWAHDRNIWSTIIISPGGAGTKFLERAITEYDAIVRAGGLPVAWSIENYDVCGPIFSKACDSAHDAPVGSDQGASTVAGVALWFSRNALVRPSNVGLP